MDLEICCPSCKRVNYIMLPRSKWKDKRYHKCMWCKEGMSVQVVVDRVSDIESFLLIQRGVSHVSGPGYPEDSKTLKGEEGVSVDQAPENY